MATTSERVEIATPGGVMGAYLARPVRDLPCPGVLLFMEIFGVNEHIRSVADRIAAEGYVVMAPDLFHRAAPGVELDYDEQGLARGIELVGKVTDATLLGDVRAAYGTLIGRDDTTDVVGAIGFCFGGHVAYLAACELPLRATASFYGGGIAGPPMGGAKRPTVERTGEIRGKVLCLFGEHDSYIPASDVEAMRSALEQAGVRHDVVVYPGAGHGFFCDARPDYRPDVADDAWRRVRDLFAEELGGEPLSRAS